MAYLSDDYIEKFMRGQIVESIAMSAPGSGVFIIKFESGEFLTIYPFYDGSLRIIVTPFDKRGKVKQSLDIYRN